MQLLHCDISGFSAKSKDILYRIQIHPDVKVDFISSAVEGILGITPEEICQKPELFVYYLYSSEERTVVEEQIFSITTKGGEKVWLECRNSVFTEGSKLIVEGVARDVSSRIEEEQRIDQLGQVIEYLVLHLMRKMSFIEVEAAVYVFLEKLAAVVAGESATVVFLNEVSSQVEKVIEWNKLGLQRKQEIKAFYQKQWPNICREILASKGLQVLSADDETMLSPEERELFAHSGVERVLLIPLMYQGGLIGFINLPVVKGGKAFSDKFFSGLEMVGLSFGSIYVRQVYMIRYRVLLDTQTDLIARVNPQGKITYVNDSYCKTFGRSREELIGTSFFSVVQDSDREKVIEAMNKMMVPPFKAQLELGVMMSDGLRWLVWENVVLKDEESNTVEIQAVGRDITSLKHTQQELRESNLELSILAKNLELAYKEIEDRERLFRLNFEEASIGMLIVNLDRTIIKANNAVCRQFGYTRKELEGMDFLQLTHPEDIEKSGDLVGKFIDNQLETFTMEKRYIKKDGSTLEANVNISLACDDKCQPLYFSTQIEDITAKKEAERQIIEQEMELRRQEEKLKYNELKNHFFANLSHELRTPLNMIFSAVQMMALKQQKDGQASIYEKYTRLIKQNGYRLLKLTNNLIDMTKIDANSFELNLANHDIIEIVNKITCSTKEYIMTNKRRLDFSSNVEHKIIACDPFSIERIILNLISNAVKFTEVGASITVTIRAEETDVLISVKDTGIGIKKEKLGIIFEPFRQSDESFRRRAEGSGLGLSIVKSLVDLYGGRIWVESELGKGSEFFIQLPVRLVDEEKQVERCYQPQNLIDKIDVEFSDIYNL